MAEVRTTLTVFGSCNMDLVVYVAAAPARGATVLGRRFDTVAGGKGANQAVAAALAGADVHMIGAVGEDDFGERIRANLASNGVHTERLRQVPGHSGTAHIVVDDEGGNSIVVVPAANAALDGLHPGDPEVIASSDGLLLQLETPIGGVVEAADAARRQSVPVILTPAPAAELPDELWANVDLLVPNEHEAEVLTGYAEPRRALDALLELVPEVVITLGEAGALYASRGGESLECPAFSVSATDTTAAGDVFTGVLSAARAEGVAMSTALRRATAAAALSVQLEGASSSMPTRRRIMDFLADVDYADRT